MHSIHLSDELKVTFPERPAEFDVGVEVGAVAALMAMPVHQFTRRLSEEGLRAGRSLAATLGYRCSHVADGTGNLGQPMFAVTFLREPPKPTVSPAARRFSVVGGTDPR